MAAVSGGTMTDSVLAIKNLKIFSNENDAVIVDGIDIDIKNGESLGIVGESGSGKTLTLRSLIGLIPEGVHISFDDKTDNDKIAMIFQNPVKALDPLYPVVKQLREVYLAHHGALDAHAGRKSIGDRFMRLLAGEGAKNAVGRKKSGKEAECDKWIKSIMQRLSLPEELLDEDRYPRSLSGGQCQRIGIAMALACEPEVLLCDEPTTALDVTVQKQTVELIKELQSEYGFAIVFVTHNLAVASEMCDRIMVLKNGRIVEEGKTSELLKDPKDSYTKMLVDSVLTVPERN